MCAYALWSLTRFQGQFFPYFILTITALVTVPLTFSLLKPTKGERQFTPRTQVPETIR